MRLRRGQAEGGFTLLEVLVALVVVAVGLSAVTRLAIQQSRSARVLNDVTLASWVASNAIETVRLDGRQLGPGRRQGQSTMGFDRWYWEMDVAVTEVEQILRLDVVVFADSQRLRPVVSLTGFAPTP
ncbi:MAG: type II secretion system minor pseudopilin GspI [Pseudomonadota bacterium]